MAFTTLQERTAARNGGAKGNHEKSRFAGVVGKAHLCERGYADEQNMGERHRQHQNDRCDEEAPLASTYLEAADGKDFNGAGMSRKRPQR